MTETNYFFDYYLRIDDGKRLRMCEATLEGAKKKADTVFAKEERAIWEGNDEVGYRIVAWKNTRLFWIYPGMTDMEFKAELKKLSEGESKMTELKKYEIAEENKRDRLEIEEIRRDAILRSRLDKLVTRLTGLMYLTGSAGVVMFLIMLIKGEI